MNNLDLALFKMKQDKKQERLATVISERFCFNTDTYESVDYMCEPNGCDQCQFKDSKDCTADLYNWLMTEVDDK